MYEGLIYTNDNCIGCNKCVRICSSFGATVSESGPARSAIRINPERCIVCGACVDVCTHNARQYLDDTDRFLADLAAGEPISVLVAPAFAAKHPTTYRSVFAALRKLGVKRIIPVSFGADICTWAYLKFFAEGKGLEMISTSCPAVVSYVEHWVPELIERLMPVKSPMMCLATYCREQLHLTERFAFLGPCIAKKLETNRYPDLVQYNVTFPKLLNRLGVLDDCGVSDYDDLAYGLGCYYPAPGGLADNVRWLLGDDVPIRVVSGKQYLYQRFEQGRHNILAKDLPYELIDALNCTEGCIEGTAREEGVPEELALANLQMVRAVSKSQDPSSPWNPNLTCEQRLARLNEQFASLDVTSYQATFRDLSSTCTVSIPTPAEANEIFESLHKKDLESRQINCSACGYESCYEMVVAIHNGFNNRYNCVYFEKEETVLLTRMSYVDQLTGVMNRNALEMTSTSLYGKGHALGLIVADVDGLKHENDTKGHTSGDWLIISTAKAFASRFGRERVFRTGGDEFLVIIEDYPHHEIQEGIASIKSHLASFGVSASMGMAYVEDYQGGFDELEKLADARMYEDKAHYYERSGQQRRGFV